MVGRDEPIGSEQLLAEAVGATRRTQLANERNRLAWWRTGLTAPAVALGAGRDVPELDAGRVVPELDDSTTHWPCVLAGVGGFALWGPSRSATAPCP